MAFVYLESLRVCFWGGGGREEENILEGALLRSFWRLLGPGEGFWNLIAPISKANTQDVEMFENHNMFFIVSCAQSKSKFKRSFKSPSAKTA